MQYQWWKNVLNFLSIADAIYTQHLLLCHRHGDTTIVPIPSLSLSLSLSLSASCTKKPTAKHVESSLVSAPPTIIFYLVEERQIKVNFKT